MRIGFLSRLFLVASLLIAASFVGYSAQKHPVASVQGSSAKAPAFHENYGRLPMSFEANQGQAAAGVRFLSHGRGYSVMLTGSSAILALSKSNEISQPVASLRTGAARNWNHTPASTDVVRMEMVHANTSASVSGADQLPGTANYLIGNDASKWRRGVPTYARVRYSNLYKGIDLVFYGNKRQLEYDFVVAPQGDPAAIRMRFAGAGGVSLSAAGALVVHAGSGQLDFQKPVVYQEASGSREPVRGSFTLLSKSVVSFSIGKYDRTRPLFIDPVLVYSTYLGGSADDSASSLAIDASGNAYVTGTTASTDFPLSSNAYQKKNKTGSIMYTAFVTKINASGTALVYSTYLGGSGNPATYSGDQANDIAVDAAGHAYVVGITASSNFPVTHGAFQTTNKVHHSTGTGFVTELNPTGSGLEYSTFLGGSDYDEAAAVAVDRSGNAYIAGWTQSADFPVTAGAFQTSRGGYFDTSFVTKLNAAGNALVYSTFLGGSGADLAGGIAVDGLGSAYIAGAAGSADFPVTPGAWQPNPHGASDGFVTKLDPTGSALDYSTYLGGSGNDGASRIAIDNLGDAYVVGSTKSSDFPVTPGALQTTNFGAYQHNPTAFVSSLNPDGTSLRYSTFLGGSGLPGGAGGDSASAIAVDSTGNAYVTGSTASPDFPWTSGAYQTVNNEGGNRNGNAFVTELNATGSGTIYSTCLGGSGANFGGDSGSGIAVDASGNVYVAGTTYSSNFPVTTGAFQTALNGPTDVFISRFDLSSVPLTIQTTMTLTSIANPQVEGQTVSFTATVAGDGTTEVPTGSVSFSQNGLPLATLPLGPSGTATLSTASLPGGGHDIYAYYGGDSTFDPNKALLLENIISANTVVFSPPQGKFVGAVLVSMSDLNPAATIHFTMDGSDPTPASPVYGQPISITQSTLFKAIGTSSQYAPGPFTQAFYSIIQQTPTPVIGPASGSYPVGQLITISDADAAATIRYTSDGSTPTTKSNWYHGPIVLTASETIKAIAISTGMAGSDAATAVYTTP